MPNEWPPEPWRSFFDELDRSLTEPVELHCLGGFVVVHAFGVGRTTNDIDFIAWVPTGLQPSLSDLGGRGSPLHRKYKVYLDPVTIVNVPENYASRLTPLFAEKWKFLSLFALEAHDVALSKLERNFERDRDDVRRLVDAGHLHSPILIERYKAELRPHLPMPEREDLTLRLWIESYWPNT